MEAVEYAECISAVEYTPPPLIYTGYDVKPSDREATILEPWECGVPLSLPLLPGQV